MHCAYKKLCDRAPTPNRNKLVSQPSTLNQTRPLVIHLGSVLSPQRDQTFPGMNHPLPLIEPHQKPDDQALQPPNPIGSQKQQSNQTLPNQLGPSRTNSQPEGSPRTALELIPFGRTLKRSSTKDPIPSRAIHSPADPRSEPGHSTPS